MMKRILAWILCLCLAAGCGAAAAEETEKENVLEQVEAFFARWSENDLNGMLELCSDAWKEQQENPKTSLFRLLGNRTPVRYEINTVYGTEADTERTALIDALFDRHNGQEPLWNRLQVIMVKEGGEWYISPECLSVYEYTSRPADVKPEEDTGEEADEDTFLLKVWNHSSTEFSYLRFDILVRGESRAVVASCPNEGEDFYRMPYTPESADELEDMQINISYGISDLPPEEAILELMKGSPAEEYPVATLAIAPVCGTVYKLFLIDDEDETWLLPLGSGTVVRDLNTPEPTPEPGADREIQARLLAFFSAWNAGNKEKMLDYCAGEWKAAQEDPEAALAALTGERTPLSLEVQEVGGEDGDAVREARAMCVIDTHRDNMIQWVEFEAEMRLEADGLWYLNPDSLADGLTVEESMMEPTSAPTEAPTPEPTEAP